MLFYISHKLVSELKNNPTDKRLIEAIDNLAFARKQGYHLLIAELKDLSFLRKLKTLQSNSQSTFNSLYQTWTEIGNFKNRFKYYVEIVPEPEILKIKKEENKDIIQLSVNYIQEFKILNETKIIAENQKEIEFYIFISNLFKQKNRLKFPSKYSPLMGGGDTTALVYNTEQKKMKSFCLCFADKDVKYPECANGKTLKKLEKVNNKTMPLSKLIPIDAREIENLIPAKLLKIACAKDINRKKGYEFIQKLINIELNEDIKYLDLKKGLSLQKFIELKDQKHIEFLKKILSKTNTRDPKDFDNYRNFIDTIKDFSTDSKQKFNKSKENYVKENNIENNILDFFDNPIILYGMGEDLLNRIIDKHIDNNTITKDDLLQFQIKEWYKIGEYITFWTCGASHLSS